MKKAILSSLAIVMMILCSVSTTAKNVADFGEWIAALAPGDDSAYIIESCQSAKEIITIPESLNNIPVVGVGDFAFMSNHNVREVAFSSNIIEIGRYVFQDCQNLRKVECDTALEQISSGAFSEIASLKEINLEGTSLKTLGDYAFSHSGIEEIDLPDTCNSIGGSAFAACDSLIKITIPASVTEIGEDAFRSSRNVVIYTPYGSYASEYAKAKGISYVYTDLSEITYVRGDADGDGIVNIMDATKIQLLLAKFTEDVDGGIAIRSTLSDEGFGIMDATRIQRKLALYDDPYRIGDSITVFLSRNGEIVLTDAITA